VADEKPKKGWFKTVVGSIAGLISGGAVMYVTPLVDKVVKPGKPLANFRYEVSGMQATFQNLSSGSDGFWDFGDGSPLEPITSPTQTVIHTFPKPGNYNVKLMVKNFIGDDSDRAVPVEIKPMEPPKILVLQAEPAWAFAPATFKVKAQTKNADAVVLACGDERPWDINTDNTAEFDRLITFNKPGDYSVQLAALSGRQSDRQVVTVSVKPAPAGMLTAYVMFRESATRVEGVDRVTQLPLPRDAKDAPFSRTIDASRGFAITKAELPKNLPAGVKSATAEISKDGKTVTVKGEVAAAKMSAAAKGQAAMPSLALNYHEERQSQVGRPESTIPVTLQVPGSTKVPLAAVPRDWKSMKRDVRLEIRDGTKPLFSANALPNNSPIVVGGRPYTVTATQMGEEVRIDIKATQ